MRQADRRELTRARLVRAAQSVFSRRGYHHGSLREIAEAAGVSTGALYYNFSSKEELFLALLDARMEERLQEIETVLASEQPPEAGLEQSAVDYINDLKRNREWITLFFEFLAHAARDPDFRERFGERFKAFWGALAEVIERRSRQNGIELLLPAEHIAIAMDVTGIGFMIPRIVDPAAVPDDLLGKTLASMLRGLAEQSRESGRA